MISLVQLPVHCCYTGNTVRLQRYGYGSYWLTYVHCSHYKCMVTQNAQRRLVRAIKARQPRGGCETVNRSCFNVLLFTLCVCAIRSLHCGAIKYFVVFLSNYLLLQLLRQNCCVVGIRSPMPIRVWLGKLCLTTHSVGVIRRNDRHSKKWKLGPKQSTTALGSLQRHTQYRATATYRIVDPAPFLA